MTFRYLVFLFCLMFSQAALAGPWLREKGSGFSSFTFASTVDFDTATQSYLEYGFTENTTVGLDLGFIRPRGGHQGGYGTLFMRRALTPPDASSKWAYELGLGVAWGDGEVLPNVKTALTWGRGLTFGEKSGWTTVDAALIWDLAYDNRLLKIDGTIGVNFSERIGAMMQVFFLHADGASATTLAPSIIISPKDSKFRIQVGTETALGEVEGSVLKLALWREF